MNKLILCFILIFFCGCVIEPISNPGAMMALDQYYRGGYNVSPYRQQNYPQLKPITPGMYIPDNYWQEEAAYQEWFGGFEWK